MIEIEAPLDMPAAEARRKVVELLEEGRNQILIAYQKALSPSKRFNPQVAGGGRWDHYDQLRIEVRLGAVAVGYSRPKTWTKFEIKLLDGYVVFTNLDSGKEFHRTRVRNPKYGEEFVTNMSKTIEAQTEAKRTD